MDFILEKPGNSLLFKKEKSSPAALRTKATKADTHSIGVL
jgi:hypothetical protein